MSPSARTWIAEVLGTFVLVFFGSLAILASSTPDFGGDPRVVVIAFGFGLALLAGLYAFGEVSGGHFNPAVSLAALVDRRIDVGTFIAYLVAQVGGAILASVVVLAASSQDAVAATTTQLGTGVEAWEGFLLETVFTAAFVAVILYVTLSKANLGTAFLGISLTLAVIHLGGVPFTGASVNPARSLAPAIVGQVGADLWIYLTAPFVGALVGWCCTRR